MSMANGDEASGFIVNETAQELSLRPDGGALTTFAKSDIVDRRPSTLSAVPDDLQKDMSVATWST